MRNTYLFCIMLFVGSFIYAGNPPKLELTKDGFEPIIYTIEGKTAKELYHSVKEWVQLTYERPDYVVKADIPDKYIRLEGRTADTWCYKAMGINYCYHTSYTLELDFKDGKYKLSLKLDRFYTGSKRATFTYTNFFKKDGSVRSVYDEGYESLNSSMNNFVESLYNYTSGNITRDEDW